MRLIATLILTGITLSLSCATLIPAVGSSEATVNNEPQWFFDRITFEIAPVDSASPDRRALELFRERLDAAQICSRDRIEFVLRPPIDYDLSGTFWVWDGQQLDIYESRFRTLLDPTPGDRNLTIFVPYVQGLWLDRGGLRVIGGVRYNPTSFAIFDNSLDDWEADVLLHEFGHILGLVRDPKLENHDDEHPYHCIDDKCIMYWTTAVQRGASFGPICRRLVDQQIRSRNKR